MSFMEDLLNRAENALQKSVDETRSAIGITATNIFDVVGKSFGYDNSVNSLEHYREASGKDVNIPSDTLRKFKTIRDAENKNQQRLFNTLAQQRNIHRINPDRTSEPVTIDQLKDNDRIVLKDYFDADIKPDQEDNNGDQDLHYSLGNFKMRSNSNLQFVKFGDKLLPYGNVEHTINDVYDFNPGNRFNLLLSPMEKTGEAKIYTNKSTWKTQPIGVIRINGNKLDTSGVEWHIIPPF